MGKYLRMSKGAEEEVAVIGVEMKRAREVVDGEETNVVKRRKIGEGEAELKPSSPATPSLPQLETDRCVIVPVNSVAPARLAIDRAQASSCSIFSQSSELSMENLNSVDPEEDESGFTTPKRNSDCDESGKTTPLKELVPPKLEPKTAKWLKYRLISEVIVDKPLADGMKEFFAAEEQKQLKQFAEKYNFDFENEKPLEGRYEWVKSLEP